MPTDTNKSRLLSREQITLTQEEYGRWVKSRSRCRGANDFGCLLCGRLFKPGDTIRWIYANGGDGIFRGGNFYVCKRCDDEHMRSDPAVLQKACEVQEALNYLMALRHPQVIRMMNHAD